MVVSIQFSGGLRTLTRKDEITVRCLDEARVIDVFRYVKSSYPNLLLREADIFVTVNDKITDLNHNLRANDRIGFLPHIGGG
jgi:molybdopterin converting factor small subunit